jgi:hypothetical protein
MTTTAAELRGGAMIGLTGQGMDGGLPNNNQPNNESKACGATSTMTAERGDKNWGNDRVDRGAEWLRGNKHNKNNDNK